MTFKSGEKGNKRHFFPLLGGALSVCLPFPLEGQLPAGPLLRLRTVLGTLSTGAENFCSTPVVACRSKDRWWGHGTLELAEMSSPLTEVETENACEQDQVVSS